jgi:cellulose synthase/poly-beta-1,6-N-acetylglucosamine synthase-like glycosyltransferase
MVAEPGSLTFSGMACMDAIWIAIPAVFAVLAVVQGVLVAVQAHEHRRFTRSRLACLDSYRPKGRTILFVPCRGRDLGLARNLASLFEQDYDDYEIRFLVETPADPVCRAIQKVAADYPERLSRIVFTGKAVDCGQKVHNLLRGTESLPGDVRYLAFVDSDARPRAHWLRALVYRLDNDRIGATTGYRWFVPIRSTAPNLLATSVNASLGMLLGSGNPNIVWGGSWAIRRDRFEQLEIREAWKRKLNDDLVVTGILHRSRLRVEYEPACAVASPLDLSLTEMLDFARRQYLQARFYLPGYWRSGLFLTTFSLTAFYLSVTATIALWRNGSAVAWLPALVALTLYTSWFYRGLYRVWLSKELFPDYEHRLRKTRLLDLLGGPVAGLANWFIFAGTAFGHRLVWREIHYVLDLDGNVISVRHKEGRLLADSRPTAPSTIETGDQPASHSPAAGS